MPRTTEGPCIASARSQDLLIPYWTLTIVGFSVRLASHFQLLENQDIISFALQKLAKGDVGDGNDRLSLDRRLFRYAEIGESDIRAEMARLETERETEEQRLTELVGAKKNMKTLSSAEVKLKEYCERVRRSLKLFTFEAERAALET